MIKELVTHIVKQLVEFPDQVAIIEQKKDDQLIGYEIYVDDRDRGKVIGREGNTIKAIRGLIGAVGQEVISITIASPQ